MQSLKSSLKRLRSKIGAASKVASPAQQAQHMQIAQNSSGYIHVSQAPTQDIDLWAGDVMIGTIPANSTALPMHAIANNASALKASGLKAISKDKSVETSLDATLFLDQYFGSDALLDKLRAMTGPGVWNVYRIGFDPNGDVRIVFGVIIPMGMSEEEVWISCNGEECSEIDLHSDPNLEYSHWFMPKGQIIGGTAVFPLKNRGEYINFSFNFRDPKWAKESRAYRDTENYTNLKLLDGLPNIERIKRVSGQSANANSFLNGGRNASVRILDIAETHGVDISKNLDILDWGVGCGRVARHMMLHTNLSVSGIDIDADNVGWCADNLTGDYLLTGLMPPSPCSAETFDLIYSCSVLSHLTVEATDAWLKEINRLLKPGGLAILSYNGDTNVASYLGKRPKELRETLNKTMFVGDINHDLDGFIPSDDYYRASFAESDWWIKKFKEHLKLVDVETAVVSGFQDMAILTKI